MLFLSECKNYDVHVLSFWITAPCDWLKKKNSHHFLIQLEVKPKACCDLFSTQIVLASMSAVHVLA